MTIVWPVWAQVVASVTLHNIHMSQLCMASHFHCECKSVHCADLAPRCFQMNKRRNRRLRANQVFLFSMCHLKTFHHPQHFMIRAVWSFLWSHMGRVGGFHGVSSLCLSCKPRRSRATLQNVSVAFLIVINLPLHHGIAPVLLIVQCCACVILLTHYHFCVPVLEQQKIKVSTELCDAVWGNVSCFHFNHLLLEGLYWIYYLLRLILKCFVKKRE